MGRKKVVKDIYNEIIISLTDTNNLGIGKMLFRAYDDGIAFRYQMNDNKKNQDSLIIINELTEFNLSEDAQAWWTPAIKKTGMNTYTKNQKCQPWIRVIHL